MEHEIIAIIEHPLFLLIVGAGSSGGLVLPWLTKRWQNYQYYLEIKNKIIHSFHESLDKANTMQYTLLREICDIYGLPQFSFKEAPQEDNYTNATLETNTIPSLPSSDVTDLYQTFKEEIKTPRMNHHLLVSKLNLYAKNEELVKDVKDLEQFTFDASRKLSSLAKSRTESRLRTTAFESANLIWENRVKLELFMTKLAETKIKKVQV